MANPQGIGLKHFKGNNHFLWKGDNASYSAIHYWLYRQVGKAKKCSNCGSERWVEWANISGEYKRNISDYRELCRKCHAKFDDYINKGWITRKGVDYH